MCRCPMRWSFGNWCNCCLWRIEMLSLYLGKGLKKMSWRNQKSFCWSQQIVFIDCWFCLIGCCLMNWLQTGSYLFCLPARTHYCRFLERMMNWKQSLNCQMMVSYHLMNLYLLLLFYQIWCQWFGCCQIWGCLIGCYFSMVDCFECSMSLRQCCFGGFECLRYCYFECFECYRQIWYSGINFRCFLH